MHAEILKLGVDWALLVSGFRPKDASKLVVLFALSVADLKACVHFCAISETGK